VESATARSTHVEEEEEGVDLDPASPPPDPASRHATADREGAKSHAALPPEEELGLWGRELRQSEGCDLSHSIYISPIEVGPGLLLGIRNIDGGRPYK
jgi:hypothetical protein